MEHIPALVAAFEGSVVPRLAKDAADVLWARCRDSGDELHELFATVFDRLQVARQTLRGCGRHDLRQSVALLVLLGRFAAAFQAAVTKHRAQHLLVRFATKRATLERLKALHKDISAIFRCLGLQKHPEMNRWRREWVQVCERMYALFEVRVAKPKLAIMRLPNAQIAEMLGMMKFELEYHEKELSPKQLKLMKDTMTKVVRCSNVHVPKISPFYIPSADLELGEHHEAVKDTSCEVKRGVYDQGTRLVAQYMSADDRYARQLFWSATTMWHGFQHANVAKILGESLVETEPFVVWEDGAIYGNFIHYFADEHELYQKRLWRMFLQAGHGLNYIHQQGKSHGSLKCSHILVAEDGTPKICHFDLSKKRVGAIDRWKGPEYNLGKGLDPSKAGDVYAFGLCIIEARTGDIPYGLDCDESIKSQLEELDCYPRPDGLRDDEWNVVRRFVAHKPEDRPTMAQAIEMIEELAWKEALEDTDNCKTALENCRTDV